MYAKIIGTGSYFPKQIRTNSDLEKIIKTSDKWISTRTGIKERRIADNKETVANMGFKATLCALNMSKIDKNKIGLIIVATTTSNYAFPSTACMIQKMLKIKNLAAFDISAACSGFIYALSIAEQYIKNNVFKYALVIGSDILSRYLNPKDRSTFILFGDGAGAVILGQNKIPGIISTYLCANSTNSNLLVLKYSKNKTSYLKMIGNEVFKIAVKTLSQALNKTLKDNNIPIKSLDWLIPHQANLRIIKATAKKTGINIQKIIITLDRYGNTSAASIPTSLDEGIRDGRIKKGNLLLLEAFGGGFTWGTILVRF